MTHAEFIASYRAGRIRADIDPRAAGQMIAARMLLPWFLLPLLGCAVALALLGQLLAGSILLVVTWSLRRLVLASAPGYVAQRILVDQAFYELALHRGVVVVVGIP